MIRRALATLLLPLLSVPLLGADTVIKRSEGNGGARESAPTSGRSSGGDAPSSAPSRTTIHRNTDPRPATGRDHWTSDQSERRGSRGVGRSSNPNRISPAAPGGGQHLRERRTGTSVGVGRTRIVRQSNGGPAPERHGAIINNTTIIRNIDRHRRTEVVPNRDYWHNVNGNRYVHRYRGGHHWYGFYHGSSFYWTRYHRDRWWWYDNGFGHWVYWSGGRWWWPGPGGVAYVYVDNSYAPYDTVAGDIEAPSGEAETLPALPAESKGGEWTSPDGKRLVQIHGDKSEAFLYDKAGVQPVFMTYLGTNVEKVRFSGGTDGKPTRILVDFKDGSFSLFSDDGEPLDADPPATPSAPPDLPDEKDEN